ncbi:cAMP-dependent protein kinase catalytic subunit [Mucor velutinosus]|uniref:cAMP-dependent protein kinase catalytic subunit n=1 Tax=Mucor velutinosus TaxID=708070 RepID=A0AAN7DIL5_9FUNG|nr:cAMP-dependent protein kinase catalytic subunit [Mucor velutinosus]
MEEAKLLGKQESPEIDSLSDTEEVAAALPFDTKPTFRNILQNEIAQNIKAEDSLLNEENVKNQLAMSNPSNNGTKGEDEEDLNAAKALLQDEGMAPLLEDEEVTQSQTEEDVTNALEQSKPMDTQPQPMQTDTQEISVPVDTQEQPDTQEQQEPADTQRQPALTDEQQQSVQADVQELPMPADTQQQSAPMETDKAHENVSDGNIEEDIIKEEVVDIKPPGEQPIAKDYYYRCRSCNQVLENLRGLVEHRMAKHNVHPRPHLFTHMDLEPVVSDPDHYCRSCDMYFISRMRYRDHLENAHHMILKPLRRPTYVIDEDPKFYCEICDKYLRNKYMHRYHLQKQHNMELPPLKRKANPDITPDLDNPDFYCASCEYKFKNKGAFRTHCEKIHKMQVQKKSRIVKEGTPDVYDPHNHCKVCEHTFTSKQKYKRHCRNVHKMDDPALRPHLLKRVSTPKFFCKTCDMPLYKDSYYLRHLSLTHDVEIISLHHDEDDTESRADIIELIRTRKAEIDQGESPEYESRPQIVTVDIESADTKASPSENHIQSTKNAITVIESATEFSKINAASSETQAESVNTPNKPMALCRRTTKRVRFADLPTKIDDTPTGYDSSQTESDDHQPDLEENDPLYSDDADQSESDENPRRISPRLRLKQGHVPT